MQITSLSGEFANATTETAFLEYKLAQTRSLLGFTLTFCTLFYLLFFVTDVAVLGLGPDTMTLFGTRIAVAVTAGTCAWFAYRHPLTVRATRRAATIAEIVALTCFMVIAVHRPAEFHWHAMSLAIMLIVIYLYIPNRLTYALILAICSTATFLVLSWQAANMLPADILTMSLLLILANTFGAVAARRFNTVSREEFRAQLVLKDAADRDHLTGCFNRRYLHEHLMPTELARAQRLSQNLTVVLCDIDYFKRINDTYGHADGDAVLRAFADLLKQMTRDQFDSIVRYGGEEFLLILPSTDLDGGQHLSERLRSAFAMMQIRSSENGNVVRATASFGISTAHFGQMATSYTLHDLISSADKMMYEAKRNGRNRVEAFQLC
ncbi:GGDEF domain-containing protein [Massilia consociata]